MARRWNNQNVGHLNVPAYTIYRTTAGEYSAPAGVLLMKLTHPTPDASFDGQFLVKIGSLPLEEFRV